MKSPFPGMDPYLQQHWRDVHSRLVLYGCDQLQVRLPTDLLARVEERVYVERDEVPDRSSYPDVRVIEREAKGVASAAIEDEIAVAEPIIVNYHEEPVKEWSIKIVDASSGNRVLTVIEFISPSNKMPGAGRKLYREKQWELQSAGVTLVEIDLVLGGKHVLSVPLSRLKLRDRTRYQVVVRRGWKWDRAEVYPLPLQKRLPAIPIPLRKTDNDAPLNLQALVDQCYKNGRYDSLNYQEDADPPLEGHDAEWADALLREAGKRK